MCWLVMCSLKPQEKTKKRSSKEIINFTFFEYLKITGSKENWIKFELNELDRSSFLSHLNKIRDIRNKIAHYSPNLIIESEKYSLKITSELLLEISHKIKWYSHIAMCFMLSCSGFLLNF